MKKFGILFASALALVALASCTDETEIYPGGEERQDEETCAAQASVTSSDANFTATGNGGTIQFKTEGGSVTLNVSCGCGWLLENSATDLFTTTTTGSSVTVTAVQNTVEEDLTGTITFMTENYRITFATITVNQTAYGAPEISVSVNEWHAPAVGALTTEIGVEASADWTAESADEWLTVTKTESGITLTAAENEEAEGRDTKVTLTCTDGIRTAYEYVAVTQDAKAYITLSNEILTVLGNANSASVDVETNFDDWSYDKSDDWITLARNGDALIVSIDANEGETRNGTVTVTAGDGAENVAQAILTVTQCGIADMILTYTITSANTSTKLPIYGTVNCTVDWGDGSEVQTVTSSNPSHTYASAGEYDVVINGTVTRLYSYNISSSTSPLPITAVKQWGLTGLTDMQYAFYYCTNLNSLPEYTGDAFADVTSFIYGFGFCSGLEVIPEGLFANSPKVTEARQLFYGCTSLKTVPAGLFDDWTKVTTLRSVFYNCSSLEEIHAGMFANCSEVTDFGYALYGCSSMKGIPTEGIFGDCSKVTSFTCAFYNCYTITEIPADLFGSCPKATDFSFVFYGCTSLTEVPAGLFDGCTAATTFQSGFYNCTSLAKVPAGLFANCTNVTTYQYTFSYCSSLNNLPEEGIFGNCSKVTTFQYTFWNCTSLEEIPASLFEGGTSVQTFTYTFYGCTSLKSVPKGLFDNLTKVTTFQVAFYNCSSLETIPEGLFDNCTEVTTFNSTFYGCSSLKAIPDGLFDNCPKVTTFYAVFYKCATLTAIPKGLFDKNTAVTNMSYLFYDCTSLSSIPDKLFDNSTLVTTFSSLFYDCYALEEIPAGLFDNCPLCTNYSYLCRNCTSLKIVPEGLFDNSPDVTNFSLVFYGCSSLPSIPPSIFSKNTKVTNFLNAFKGDTALTGESPYDTINGEKVHLYERANHTDIYSTPTSTDGCFDSCTGLSDYYSIPSAWGGGGN